MNFREVSLTALVPIIIADKESVSNDSTREETKWNVVFADILIRGHKSHLSDVWSYLCSAQDHRDHFTHRTLQSSDSAPEVVAPEFEPEKPKQDPEIDSEEHQDIVEDIN